MAAKSSFTIVVLPGDGIGVDVTAEALKVLRAAEKQTGTFQLDCKSYDCGAVCYQRTGDDLPAATMDACRNADAVLLGAMGHPDIRKLDGTELTPQVTLRVELDLYAGVRPCKLYLGARSPLKNPGDLDFVILREQTEGLFASQQGGIVLHDDVATDTLVMTRPGIRRICEFAFRLAQDRTRKDPKRTRKVTAVDKANIFKSFAFFRKIFREVGAQFPEIEKESTYIDAQALYLVQRPERFDVIVTENMFGDILSDLAAGLIGGMGMAPSADIGDRHAVFQPAHGTAPDIAGKSIANPIAAILSAGMMLDWLGRRHEHEGLRAAAKRIDDAVTHVLADGKILPVDQGGSATTHEFGDAVAHAVEQVSNLSS
ncbi:MAG: isocitrate/isopropylmalate dehydrogenase family protein [Gemmataceae bacterium]|nr:isocitrate/isopropylmalate dehydrogenase family protein [Gemmataceae bacterium]MCI0739909.1 isocitrate/isopropylmalate dehydrogenase family protein [Gemmataceae bacterium]